MQELELLIPSICSKRGQQQPTAASPYSCGSMKWKSLSSGCRRHVQPAAELLLCETNPTRTYQSADAEVYFKCWPVIMYVYHMLVVWALTPTHTRLYFMQNKVGACQRRGRSREKSLEGSAVWFITLKRVLQTKSHHISFWKCSWNRTLWQIYNIANNPGFFSGDPSFHPEWKIFPRLLLRHGRPFTCNYVKTFSVSLCFTFISECLDTWTVKLLNAGLLNNRRLEIKSTFADKKNRIIYFIITSRF